MVDYLTLTGVDSAENDNNEVTIDNIAVPIVGGGRLAEKDAGGNESLISNVVSGYTNEGGNEIENGTAYNRGLSGGALVLPALYGGGAETHQIMLLLSAADKYGGSGGGYKLDSRHDEIQCFPRGQYGETHCRVLLMIACSAVRQVPTFRPSAIIVEGIRVMVA